MLAGDALMVTSQSSIATACRAGPTVDSSCITFCSLSALEGVLKAFEGASATTQKLLFKTGVSSVPLFSVHSRLPCCVPAV